MWLFIIILLFIAAGLFLIGTTPKFFQNKQKILLAAISLISIIMLIQIISGGIGGGFIFLVILFLVGVVGYILYTKGYAKLGFNLVSFALFFHITFLIIQLYFKF